MYFSALTTGFIYIFHFYVQFLQQWRRWPSLCFVQGEAKDRHGIFWFLLIHITSIILNYSYNNLLIFYLGCGSWSWTQAPKSWIQNSPAIVLKYYSSGVEMLLLSGCDQLDGVSGHQATIFKIIISNNNYYPVTNCDPELHTMPWWSSNIHPFCLLVQYLLVPRKFLFLKFLEIKYWFLQQLVTVNLDLYICCYGTGNRLLYLSSTPLGPSIIIIGG